MTQEEKTRIEGRIVDVLKTVYDPEIPVNIYDLGLIYRIEVGDDGNVDIDMTFTAPSCPAADFILEDVRQKVDSLEGVKSANVNLVFEPAWDQSMLSEEARLELGIDCRRPPESPCARHAHGGNAAPYVNNTQNTSYEERIHPI